MRALFRQSRWPAVIKIAAAAWIVLGATSIVLGVGDPEGMLIRGLPHPLGAGILCAAIGVAGLAGIRFFVWFASIAWLVLAVASLISSARTDVIGNIWVWVWTTILSLPTIAFFRHELGRKKAPNQPFQPPPANRRG